MNLERYLLVINIDSSLVLEERSYEADITSPTQADIQEHLTNAALINSQLHSLLGALLLDVIGDCVGDVTS